MYFCSGFKRELNTESNLSFAQHSRQHGAVGARERRDDPGCRLYPGRDPEPAVVQGDGAAPARLSLCAAVQFSLPAFQQVQEHALV